MSEAPKHPLVYDPKADTESGDILETIPNTDGVFEPTGERRETFTANIPLSMHDYFINTVRDFTKECKIEAKLVEDTGMLSSKFQVIVTGMPESVQKFSDFIKEFGR